MTELGPKTYFCSGIVSVSWDAIYFTVMVHYVMDTVIHFFKIGYNGPIIPIYGAILAIHGAILAI